MIASRAFAFAFAFALLLPLAAAVPARAAPGGQLMTLETGKWYCELPGDAQTVPVAQPDEDFTAIPDSSYELPDGQTGTYLRLGNEVVMTSGPRGGERFHLQSEATMHKLDASGKETALRCVRAGDPAANLVEPAPTDKNSRP